MTVSTELLILDAEGLVHDRRHWPEHVCETSITDCPRGWHERVVTKDELPDRWEVCAECLRLRRAEKLERMYGRRAA